MNWNNGTESYRGVTSDGKTIDVAGIEYAEAVSDGIKIEAKARGWDPDNLTEEQHTVCTEATWEELDIPDRWTDLVGDNQNVEYVDA